MIKTRKSSLTGISTAPNKDAAYLFGTEDQILSADVGTDLCHVFYGVGDAEARLFADELKASHHQY
jgi:hypothetical protein